MKRFTLRRLTRLSPPYYVAIIVALGFAFISSYVTGFVMSSFAEGVPVVLMEAMAAGVPVVATQIAGVSELVEDGVSGYLVPPGDAFYLAECLEKLLHNSQLRVTFGIAGRAKVEKDFNINYEVRRLHRVMSAALEGKVESIRPNNSEKVVPMSEEPIINV